MLDPRYIEALPDALVELCAVLEADILEDMARRLNTYDYYIPAAQWQKKKLHDLGFTEEEILKKLSRASGRMEDEIKTLMKEAGMNAIAADGEAYRRAGLHPPPLAASVALQNVLNTGLRQTRGTFKNLTRTTAHTATGQFENALDRAWMQVKSGAFDHNTAIRNAIKDLSRQGLQAIKYPSGHTDTLEVAVRRAVVTGINKTCGEMSALRAAEMGCDLVEVSAHAGARPSHAAWQGKIYSRSGESVKYPNFEESTGYGTGAGLCGWNCRHSFSPYFEGDARAYTPEMLAEYDAKTIKYNGEMLTEYEASQKQRGIERNIRRWKRENLAMKAAGQNTSESAAKIKHWQEEEKNFIRQTGLKKQGNRAQIGGYGRGEARQTTKDAQHYYKHWIGGITQQGAPKTLADYYDMKYNNPKEYGLLKGYAKAVEKGDISPLVGFDIYKSTAAEIEAKLTGIVTSNGIEIKGFVNHFTDRVIGQVSEPHSGKRRGVSVETAREALINGEILKETVNNGKRSQQFRTGECILTVNPENGLLIQLNPNTRGKR